MKGRPCRRGCTPAHPAMPARSEGQRDLEAVVVGPGGDAGLGRNGAVDRQALLASAVAGGAHRRADGLTVTPWHRAPGIREQVVVEPHAVGSKHAPSATAASGRDADVERGGAVAAHNDLSGPARLALGIDDAEAHRLQIDAAGSPSWRAGGEHGADENAPGHRHRIVPRSGSSSSLSSGGSSQVTVAASSPPITDIAAGRAPFTWVKPSRATHALTVPSALRNRRPIGSGLPSAACSTAVAWCRRARGKSIVMPLRS